MSDEARNDGHEPKQRYVLRVGRPKKRDASGEVVAKVRGGSESRKIKGEKAVLIPLDPQDHARLKEAAEHAGVTMTELCRAAILRAVWTLEDD
jgi:hypothetical protein